MQVCRLPIPLRPGDLLWVVAPSGPLREQEALDRGIAIWQERGYRIKLASGYDDRWGYLAGTDAARRSQLRAALQDPDCRGILCLRGGYGGSRLLEDWQWTGTDPKWLIGFSDVTSLLWGLASQGHSGVHGPLLTTLYAEPDWSVQRLFDWIEGQPIQPLQGIGWGGGRASGILLPANLTVATHLLGTAVQPDLDQVILAFEDVSEAPYRLDRMLTQWRMMNCFRRVAGVALGRFSQCDPTPHIPSFTVAEVLRDRLGDLGIPVVSDLAFGHEGINAALPVGVSAELDAEQGVLSITEPRRLTRAN